MIDRQLIESANNIRKTFLKLNKDLLKYESEIKEMLEFLKGKIEYLEKYKNEKVKKIKNKEDIAVVSKEILNQIGEIETQEKRLQAKVEQINNEMEGLKRDEEILYSTILQRYPDIPEDEIIAEIHNNLEK